MNSNPSSYINIKKLVKLGDFDEFKKVFELFPDIDWSANDNLAIRIACQNGNLEIVKLLLTEKQIDPSFGDDYLLNLACQCKHPGIVEFLLSDKRVDPKAAYRRLPGIGPNFHGKVSRLLEERIKNDEAQNEEKTKNEEESQNKEKNKNEEKSQNEEKNKKEKTKNLEYYMAKLHDYAKSQNYKVSISVDF